ncbi:hypothetical protein [Cellulomonas sp. PhB143]|uniref:hypothetical protein n=1 Tax=Cellulomonas sp. PhB143 TaxID=2485186 RepID=UPI000F470F74|nr:hypothetical protein [Cellulomonas sp. PhB143]
MPDDRGPDLIELLGTGTSLEDAAWEVTTDLLDRRDLANARSFTDSLALHAPTSELGHLLRGVVAASEKKHALALYHFDLSAREPVLRRASQQYVTSLFAVDPARGLAETRDLVQGTDLPAATWWEVLRHTFTADERELSSAVLDRLEDAYRRDPQAWTLGERKIPWVRRWIDRERRKPAPAAPEGRVPFAIMDYGQPDRSWASQNIGDYIQTLASLGHVVRHQGLRFHGEQDDVVDLVNELQGRVRPELQLEGADADVQLYTLDRDASTYQEFPEGTWALTFGWFMHPLFNLDGAFDLPLHPAVRPIFVSFHCNKRSLLTPDVLAYLREHGPIGCRDWTTVDLLLSLDVPAFFSGCLTTTVNTVFPNLTEPAPKGTVYVDVVRSTVPEGVENVPQKIPAIKTRSFTRNMHDAMDLLEGYRRNYTDVITMRLHCYLPATSIGMNVRFEPKSNADVRFAGLAPLDAQQFEAIRTPMRDRLQPVIEAIFAKKSEDEVYALWREVNADDVRIARERHARPAQIDPRGADVAAAMRAVETVAPSATAGAVDVVLTPTAGQLAHLEPLLRSIGAHSSRPVTAWIVRTAGTAPSIAVDGVDVRWVDASRVPTKGLPRRDAARAALAELVPVDRAVVLPVDAFVAGDVAELLGTDLAGNLVAARTTTRAGTSGFGLLYAAGKKLDRAPDKAFELYRQMHAAHTFDFDAFDTGVMVVELAAMRSQDAAARMLGAMLAFRLGDREAYHWLVGRGRVGLEPAWAHVPTREKPDDGETKLWYWADANKPWERRYVPGASLWASAQQS